MSKQIHISILKPCHQNWNEMTANEQGAFCKSCQKNVTDFTNKTENEIYNIVTGSQEQLCGKFTVFQLQQPVRKTELRNGFLNWRAIAASLAAFFSFNKIYATGNDLDTIPKKICAINTGPKVVITSPRNINTTQVVLGQLVAQPVNKRVTGKVIEADSKEPIAYANVYLKKARLGATTDENGNFVLAIDPVMYKEDTLVVTYIGYLSKEFPLTLFDTAKPIELQMREVQIMGMMVVTKTVTPPEERIGLHHIPYFNPNDINNQRSRWQKE